jgi:TonB family protein
VEGDEGRDWYDDDDEPGGLLGGLSDGQRYVLAIVLNLGFLGAVIAGFAYLYTSGFGGAESATAAIDRDLPVEEVAASPQLAERELIGPRTQSDFDRPSALDAGLDDPSRASSSLATNPGAPDEAPDPVQPAPDSASGEEGDEGQTLLADAGREAVDVPEPYAPVESAAGALGTPDLETPDLGTPDLEALDPESADEASDEIDLAEAAPVEPPAPSPWARAGQLASELQADYPCSEFTLAASSDGQPSLRARVAATESTAAIRERVGDTFGDHLEILNGLGCTSTISAGFVAIGDDADALTLLSANQVTDVIRAVLPADDACDVIGVVIETEPVIRRAMEAGDGLGAWVRADGGAALCSRDPEGEWVVQSASAAGGRRAAALIVGEDVNIADLRRAANLGPAADLDAVRGELASTPNEAASSSQSQVASAGGAPLRPDADGLVEVAPVSGPGPRLPDGTPTSETGYQVTLSFDVDEAGAPSDLTIVSAGFAGVPVVQAALENVAASRFPSASNGSYRAKYTVRFPNAGFVNLLDRLSEVAAQPGGSASASPIWDRQPDEDDFARVYPIRALDRGVSGEVRLDCVIQYDGRVDCEVVEESPVNYGFARAALSLAERMRAGPRMSDGSPSANQSVRLPFNFRLAD